jgi:adenylate cyclase
VTGETPFDPRSVLSAFGVPDGEIERAQADGTLELLALERVLQGVGPRYDLDEVVERADLDRDVVLAYWRALGFPEPRPGEQIFNDTDLDLLANVVPFLTRSGLEEDLGIQMARVIGSAVSRVANAQVDAITGAIEMVRAEADDEEAIAHEVAEQSAALLPVMPEVMTFVWRRHLAAAARRRMVRATEPDDLSVCVGFADLVGFTAQTQQLPEHELAQVVGRFETVAHDVVNQHGGRVIKMIGDEVMFLVDDVVEGAALALDLATTLRHDDVFSDVRVGLAAGLVLERDGDVYGPVVNLASRIVRVAFPGAVVVSEDVADALDGDDRFVVRSIRSHYLKDIGRVSLFSLRPPDADEPQRYARAQAARVQYRRFLLDRRAERRREMATHSDDLPGGLSATILDADQLVDEPTGQIEAITEAVLDADMDADLQVELLADIDASRRLAALEREAAERAAQADAEAEERIVAIEAEARKKVEDLEAEAHRRIERVLVDAEARAAKVNEEASKKVERVAQETERKADAVERDAERDARRKAKSKQRDKGKRPKETS